MGEHAMILKPENWQSYLVRQPANFIEAQGHIPNLGIRFHDEIGRESVPPPNVCPASRYETGRFGLKQPNTVSVMNKEHTNGNFRQPMKGTIFNTFPPFLATPLRVSERPTLVLQIG